MIEKLEKGEASLFYVLGSWQAGGIYMRYSGEDWAVAVVHIKGRKGTRSTCSVQGYKYTKQVIILSGGLCNENKSGLCHTLSTVSTL